MSRIGKKPISIPEGVNVSLEKDVLIVKGTKGELKLNIPKEVQIKIDGNEINLKAEIEDKKAKAIYGTICALINNLIKGVVSGFEKRLEIVGVGYKVQKKGEILELGLGFTHPVEVKPIAGVTVEIDKENKMTLIISGIDKQKVGEQAARIRAIKKPEPYKGKGIKYAGEKIFRKSGKTAGN